MGSPEDEPERFADEIEHTVTLDQGLWLADSTVTQSLWEAVMGENPSEFNGANHPIERIRVMLISIRIRLLPCWLKSSNNT